MGKKDQATKDAERNRKGEAASNRRLRWKTTGESDSVELQAEAMLADQRKRPGHVDSGGVNDAEAMAEQDRQTGMKNTEAGKALEAVRKKQIEAELGKSQTSADAVANGAEVVIPTPPLRTPDNNPADTSLAPTAPGAPAAPAVGAGNPFRYGSGSKKGTGDSVSAPAPSTGQDATPPAATPPAPPAGQANGKLAPSDPMADRANEKLSGILGGVVDQKTKFAANLKEYGAKDPKERTQEEADNILAYGQTLGLDENQINAAIRGDEKLDAGNAAISAQVEAKDRADKAANTPEAKAASATAAFGKAYGAYLNGEGKTASREEKDAKYAELKGKAVEGGFVVTQEGKDRAAPAIEKARLAGEKAGKESDPALDSALADFNTKSETLRNKIDFSLGYGNMVVADATAAEPDIAARDKYFADKNVGIEKEYQADKLYDAQVAEDRNAWFEDVKKNSDDFLAVGGYKRHVTGIRKDAPMPHLQADGVTTIPRNENGGDRYKSQYDKDGNFTAKEPAKWFETNRDFSGGGKSAGEKKWHEKTLGEMSGSKTASNDVKLQQHHASIDSAKGVLQKARKITDDIWGSSYATVVG